MKKENQPCSDRASRKVRECWTSTALPPPLRPTAGIPDSESWTSSAVALAFNEQNTKEKLLDIVVPEVDRNSSSRRNGIKGKDTEERLSEEGNGRSLVDVPLNLKNERGKGKVYIIALLFWKKKKENTSENKGRGGINEKHELISLLFYIVFWEGKCGFFYGVYWWRGGVVGGSTWFTSPDIGERMKRPIGE